MLVIGLKNSGYIKGGGCTEIEYSTQMTMWSMFSAPLMIGCDVRNMSASTKKILLDKDIIALDQDTLGQQAIRMFRHNGLEAWKKPLSDDRFAIALFNRNEDATTMSVGAEDLEIEDSVQYNARELYEAAADAKPFQKLTTKLSAHETKVFILSKKRG
jgi:alpha-galactosidase